MKKEKLSKLFLRFTEPSLEAKYLTEQAGSLLTSFKINTAIFSLISVTFAAYFAIMKRFHPVIYLLSYVMLTLVSHLLLRFARRFAKVVVTSMNIISVTVLLEAYFHLVFNNSAASTNFYFLTGFFLFEGVTTRMKVGWPMGVFQQSFLSIYYLLRPAFILADEVFEEVLVMRLLLLTISAANILSKYFEEKALKTSFLNTEQYISHEKILTFFLEEVHPDPTFLINFKEYFEEQIAGKTGKPPPPKTNFLKKVSSYFFDNQAVSLSLAQPVECKEKLDEVKQSSEPGQILLENQQSKSLSLNYSSGSNPKPIKINNSEEMYQFLQNIEVVSCVWPKAINRTEDFIISKATRVTDIINILFTENVNFNDMSVTESRMSLTRMSGSFKSVRNFDLLNLKRKKKTIDRISTVVKGTYLTPDKGVRCVVNLKLSKFFYDNMPWIFVFFQDSTQRAENKYLKDLDKFKDKLLASVTHDLRTPLNLIMVMMDNARSAKTREALLDCLNLAEINANLLQSLISDILDYSLFKENKIRLIISEFSLNSLVAEVIRLFSFQATKKNVRLKYVKSFCEDDLALISDSRRVKQIMINLVSNSLKFTSNGVIAINVQEIDGLDQFFLIEIIDTGSGIKQENLNKLFRPFTTFENKIGENSNGIGLGLNICKSLIGFLGPFDYLFVTTRYGTGTKIGFYLTKALHDYAATDISTASLPTQDQLELMIREFRTWNDDNDEETNILNIQYDMEMIIEKPDMSAQRIFNIEKSPFQRDSEFSSTNNQTIPSLLNIREGRQAFSFNQVVPKPQRDCLDHPEKCKGELTNAATQKNILIVDDNMFNIFILENYINKMGKYNLFKAPDGETATQLFLRHNDPASSDPLSLIFMDINLPNKSGLETASEIVDLIIDKGFKKVVIAACTSYSGEQDKQRAFDSGIDFFFQKPLQQEEVHTFIKKTLG